MRNAVDGQLTAERRTRTMRLVGSKNTSQIEARRFRPLLGWELNGIRQRLPQGSIGVIFCLARLFLPADHSIDWWRGPQPHALRTNYPPQSQNNPVKQLAVLA